jgi:hypothetical protein
MMPYFVFGLIALTVIVLVIMLPRLARSMRQRVELARQSLATRGYAVEASYRKPIGDLTRVWGKFQAPTAFYFQITNLDPGENLAGKLGIGDIRLGYEDFDDAFVLRSSHPDQARAMLDEDLRRVLLARQTLRFRTGSINSLLGADYFPENRDTRDLREYWMLEFVGKPETVDEQALVALGQRLAQAIVSAPGIVGDAGSLRTGFFEGR